MNVQYIFQTNYDYIQVHAVARVIYLSPHNA